MENRSRATQFLLYTMCHFHPLRMGNAYRSLVGKPEGRDHSEDLGVRGKIILEWILGKSRHSSDSIALGYGLDDRGSRVRFQARDGNFSLHHRVQNGSGAHLICYPMGIRVSFPVGKAAGA
jgi:hypothetical protein